MNRFKKIIINALLKYIVFVSFFEFGVFYEDKFIKALKMLLTLWEAKTYNSTSGFCFKGSSIGNIQHKRIFL